MRKPRTKTRPYAIYYKDSTYMVYDLTEKDYENIHAAILAGTVAHTSVGLIVTTDIRSVIIQREEPKAEPKVEKPAVPDLTPEEMAFLKATLAGTGAYGEDGDVQ